MTLSLDDQVAEMGDLWPQFKLVRRNGQQAAWRGRLRPLLQPFEIGIAYRVPLVIERPDVRRTQPAVSVLSPRLRPRPGDPEGRLPHVYYLDDGSPVLCMLDPESEDWSPADSLARTTVPWIIEWLAAYEGWRATGKWAASGRHVEAT